ncbi:hypothetical protein [Blastococcus sp. CCUG 61487]|uniref:hypothetical protein n=1 Tax=Blastococcus sp. CCUG 61487 TaxID=1840703 RepID=UPI0010C11EF9|nr:hypothetical protein [Blastococcus sp. CCUG 61487]TKJ25237.1 hypothetical protein A6V29_04235 [Blastococcus sp. CCUG 61487]
MRATELRAMEPFFTRITDLQRYLATTTATANERGDCDCEVTRKGIYQLAGRCIPAGEDDPMPDHCRTLTHLTARHLLLELRLPVDHLSDPQLGKAVAGMAALVGQAPHLTQRQFVIHLQEVLGAGLSHLIPAEAPPTEETPDQ